MDFNTFSERIEIYARFINKLKYYENILLQPTTVLNATKIAAAEVYVTTYTPWSVQCNVSTFKLKDAFVERHDKALDLIDELIGNGYNPTDATKLTDLKDVRYNKLLVVEAEQIFKMYYIMDYYRRMCDETHPDSWLNDLNLFQTINDVSYSNLKTGTTKFFSNLLI
jgi:hypothetical protein